MSATKTITVKCPFCRKETTLQVDAEAYKSWKNGRLIDKAFPDLSASDREIIKTGVDDQCWNDIFGGFDERGVE